MIQEKDYKQLDIKAEVILVEVLDKYEVIDLDDIIMSPDGGFNHSVSRDIENVEIVESEHGIKRTQITVKRPGLYDALPTGYFHDISHRITSEDDKGISGLRKIKQQKDEEKSARKFFSPFDQIINRYRILVEKEERQTLTGFPLDANHTLFDIIWGDFGSVMSNYQKSVLFTLLPMTNHIIGDLQATEMSYEAVLGLPVSISHNSISKEIKDNGFNRNLGLIKLAESFVLGEESAEIEDIYLITIGPIDINQCTEFLPEAQGTRMLDMLSDYLIPIEATVKYKYLIDTENLHLTKSPTHGQMDGENRLGYSIHI